MSGIALAVSGIAEAEQALGLVEADPIRARDLARSLIADPDTSEEARSVAERAIGLLSRDLGRMPQAISHLEEAVRHARAAGSAQREVEARSTLASALMRSGDARAALRQASTAARLPGGDLPTLANNRALILQGLGRLDEAVAVFGEALELARRDGDRWTEARALSNRGVAEVYRAEFDAAERDLTAALELHREAGAGVAVAEVIHNLGFLLARQGDFPRALAHFDEAADAFAAAGLARHEGLVDRCEALIAVRLLSEARLAIEAAVGAIEAAGRSTDAAEARLMLARVCLLGGDIEAAAAAAAAAGAAFAAQNRTIFEVLAEFVATEIAWVDGGDRRSLEKRALKVAARLEVAGWVVQALECRLLAARAAIEQGRLAAARRALDAAAPARRRGGPASLRVRSWHAEALLRLAEGRRPAAIAAARAGLRVAEEHRSTLGATELQIRAAGAAGEIAELGLTLAIDSGDAAAVLAWADALRARRLGAPEARPPADPEMARLLGLLREAAARAEGAALAGEPTGAALRRQATLEAAVSRRSHIATAAPGQGRTGNSPADRHLISAVRAHLEGAALVEMVVRGRDVGAVVVGARRSALVRLAPLAEIERERGSVLFALGRLARPGGGTAEARLASLAAAAASLATAAERLDEMLISPLREAVGDETPLVLVPAGSLHASAWALLPSLSGRSITVAPSARAWLDSLAGSRHAGAHPKGERVVLVAGPGLEGAQSEVATIGRDFYPGAETLAGGDATAERVLAALDGACLVHVACHGEFRADNPFFSTLRLANGPLTLYELEDVSTPPRCLVLSACDAGLSGYDGSGGGGEPMGAAAVLLARGTRTLVASVVPVPDEGAATFMTIFHRRLVTGMPAAAALASAQAEAIGDGLDLQGLAERDPKALAYVAAAGYACFGAGSLPVLEVPRPTGTAGDEAGMMIGCHPQQSPARAS